MVGSAVSGVLARAALLLEEAGEGQGGALWRLAADDRQLDANLIRLAPGATVPEHVEPDLDVLLCVVAGGGRLTTDAGTQELRPGFVAWLPRGARRSIEAGPDGLAHLTAHRRRPGLSIRTPARQSAAHTPEPTADEAATAGRPLMTAPSARSAGPEGGEPACLLHRVCPECGRMAQESDARYCARCGERLPTD